MTDIITELHDRIRNECDEVDADKEYDVFLDECYSFRTVGGPFAYMCASKVLEECDPVAYRCGFSDWLDGEDLVDIGVGGYEYYWRDDCEQERDKFIEELEGYLSDLDDERSELEDPENETSAEQLDLELNRIDILRATYEKQIAELRKYVF